MSDKLIVPDKPCPTHNTTMRRVGLLYYCDACIGGLPVTKRDELSDPNSCMNKASIDEMTFVLLARDIAAPGTIRFWALERVRLGKNAPNDKQITDAIACAEVMERQRS